MFSLLLDIHTWESRIARLESNSTFNFLGEMPDSFLECLQMCSGNSTSLSTPVITFSPTYGHPSGCEVAGSCV